MHPLLLTLVFATLPALAYAQAATAPAATEQSASERSASAVPPARFADADRRAALARAFPDVDRILAETVARSGRPGGVLALIVDGELAHVSAAGVQDLETKTPVSADSVFRIASMTKSFTAMATLKLRDAGKLSLEDPVERHVPELRGMQKATADSPPITIRHLLSHAEGFPEDNPWGDRQLARTDAWLDEAMRRGIPFSTAPGTAFEYSNYGFGLLGRIVQNVAGVPYHEYVAREILRPLGMTATTFEVADVPAARRTQGYRRGPDGAHVPETPLPHGAFGAMGGLWTDTRDLAKYVAFLMSAFPPRDEPERGPISRASAREMQQVARYDSTRVRRRGLDGPPLLVAGGYGYGLRISEECELGITVGHGGGLPGYGSVMRWLPEHGVGLIAMSNLTYSGWGSEFDQVMEALRRTGGLSRRVVQPSAALRESQQAVSRLVLAWDEDLAARIAADNLFLDRPAAQRRDEIAKLLARHGACRAGEGDIDADNALRGRWRLPCERGYLDVGITLAPTMPPTVQHLDVQGVMPPSEALQRGVDAVLDLVRQWDGERARAIAGEAAWLPALERQAALARLHVGTCRPGETLRGDGSRVFMKLECDRGTIGMDAAVDGSGALSRVSLQPDPTRSCAP